MGYHANAVKSFRSKSNSRYLRKSEIALIKGFVKDEKGAPITNVSITISGTTIGSTTKSDGSYSISAKAGDTLIFSALNYKKETIIVGSKLIIDIVLKLEIATDTEVVVVGYGTQRKSDVTGAISRVDPGDLVKTTSASVDQALQGRTAGLSITANTGSPGSPVAVRVRGIGTVGNSEPLYVVDGIPINNISQINMNDVESIDILKDASATAIYGSRGANGVLLVKTKAGQKGSAKISINSYLGSQSRARKLDVLDGPTWARMINERSKNDGTAPIPELGNPDTLKSYNWQDLAYRNGTIQNHVISVAGGTEKSTYYLSYDYLSQDGIIKGTFFRRQSLRANNTYQLTKFITVGTNLSYSYGARSVVQESGGNPNFRVPYIGYVIEPITPIYKPDGSYNVSAYNQSSNPLSYIEHNTQVRNPANLSANIYAELRLSKKLNFKSQFGFVQDELAYEFFGDAYFTNALDQRNISSYTSRNDKLQNTVWSNTLVYDERWGKQKFSFLGGTEIQKFKSTFLQGIRQSIPTTISDPSLSSGDATRATAEGSPNNSALLSYFSRINYNYDNRYLVTANLRYDGSSKFGPNYRFGAFPSVGLGWNIHNEQFFKADFMNQFKFRMGYGIIGNQNIPNNAHYITVSNRPAYVLGRPEASSIGLAPYTPGNPDLQWEQSQTANIGLDITLFNRALNLSLDYYIKRTSKLILSLPELATAGYENPALKNAGLIENKGLEVIANYEKKVGQITINIGGNITFNSNRVLELGIAGNSILSGQALNYPTTNRTQVGSPIAQFYGYIYDGIFQTQEEVANSAVLVGNTATKPGDVKYRDISGPNGKADGVINDFDKTIIGSPLPKFIYGYNLNINYRKLDLSLFFQGSYGNKIFSANSYVLEGGFSVYNMTANVLDRWTVDNPSTNMPRLTTTNAASNFAASSRFVRDGSYMRLKNLQLGYTISRIKIKNVTVNSFRIYAAAQNLFTLTGYKYGLDPEIGFGRDPNNSIDAAVNDPLDIGVDRGVYPQSRSIILGINLNL